MRLVGLLVVISMSLGQIALAADMRGVVFAKADSDNSETLDRKEFKKFIKLLADSGHKNANIVRRLRLYDVAWRRVNLDANDVITMDEIREAKMHKVAANY